MTGWPVMTMVRGRIVTDEGDLVGDRTHGEHLTRGHSPYAVMEGIRPQ